jgi:hypothetical protein
MFSCNNRLAVYGQALQDEKFSKLYPASPSPSATTVTGYLWSTAFPEWAVCIWNTPQLYQMSDFDFRIKLTGCLISRRTASVQVRNQQIIHI